MDRCCRFPKLPSFFPALTVATLAMLASCHMNPDFAPPSLPTANATGQPDNNAVATTDTPTAPVATNPAELVPLKNRVGLRGSYTNDGEDDPWTRDGLDLEVDFGHRLNPNFEVGALAGVITSDADEILDPDLYYVGASGRYYFTDKGQVQPWAGANLGLGQGGGGFFRSGYDPNVGFGGDFYADYAGEDFTFLRIGAGVSYFASSSVALEAGLWYTQRRRDDCERQYVSLGTESIDDETFTDTVLRVGISWFF